MSSVFKCHSLCDLSPASHFGGLLFESGQYVGELWWAGWHQKAVFSHYFISVPSVSYHRWYLLISILKILRKTSVRVLVTVKRNVPSSTGEHWREYWICIYINFLTAIELTLGGSSTVHIYTSTMHRTIQLTSLVGRISGVRSQSGQTKINDEQTV
jgi:hypothetical protein